MKRHPGESIDHFRRRALVVRSATIFKHQLEVAAKRKVKVCYTLGDLRNRVVVALGTPCLYCRQPIAARTFSVDHERPVSRGGEFTLENMRIICTRCNKLKGLLLAAEFRGLLTLLEAFTPDGRSDVTRRLLMGNSRMAQMFRPKGGKKPTESFVSDREFV